MSSSAAPKNKRLTNYDRDRLKSFAKRQIEATQDRTELNAAYEVAADAVHSAVVQRWPQKDMKVLAKYDAAALDACIYVSTGSGHYDQFQFRDDDKRIALRPHLGGCRRQPILLDGPAGEAFDRYATAKDADKKQARGRYYDFRALIDHTPNFNTLAATWPAVEALRSEIVGTSASLSVLSDEVVGRLKADPAFELAEAA